jgi:DNA-binding MarR family transcriptional regulator
MARAGADLALLLLGGFRALVDAAMIELARKGHEDVRPVHEFAMRSIAAGASNASELGRRLSVSKQAAAKTIAVLEERGYVARSKVPDGQRTRLEVTPLGFEVMRVGEAIFEQLRARWAKKIGATHLAHLEAHLTTLVGETPIRFDLPGGTTHDLSAPVAPTTRHRRRRSTRARRG